MIALTAALPANQAPSIWQSAGLTVAEAEELANESLRLVIERKCVLGDLQFHKNRNLLPIAANGLGALRVRPVGDVSFEVVSDAELSARAEADGSYVYHLQFASVSRDRGKIIIELNNVPQYAAKPRRNAFGSGVTIEFMKERSGWMHSCTSGWIA